MQWSSWHGYSQASLISSRVVEWASKRLFPSSGSWSWVLKAEFGGLFWLRRILDYESSERKYLMMKNIFLNFLSNFPTIEKRFSCWLDFFCSVFHIQRAWFLWIFRPNLLGMLFCTACSELWSLFLMDSVCSGLRRPLKEIFWEKVCENFTAHVIIF